MKATSPESDLSFRPSLGVAGALVVYGIVLSLVGGAAGAASLAPEAYYRALQEDQFVEWATFWAFLGAAAVFLSTAIRGVRPAGGRTWFLLGLTLFCVVVACEEISWGQRLIGFRAPDYFQERNYQQELNLHNVVATSLRKLALKILIAAYGLVLPVVSLFDRVRVRFERWGLFAPPPALAPLFLGALVLYEHYPWRFTGELVELVLGVLFLISALAMRFGTLAGRSLSGRNVVWRLTGVMTVLSVLGMTSALASDRLIVGDPRLVTLASLEVEALRMDLQRLVDAESDRPPVRCGVHKRLLTFVEKYEETSLMRGRFSALGDQYRSSDRARYFLDPWNSPYWIRQVCEEDEPWQLTVYSFGPNRRRDSVSGHLLPDDVGVQVTAR